MKDWPDSTIRPVPSATRILQREKSNSSQERVRADLDAGNIVISAPVATRFSPATWNFSVTGSPPAIRTDAHDKQAIVSKHDFIYETF